LDLNVFVYGNKMIKGGFSLKQKFNIFCYYRQTICLCRTCYNRFTSLQIIVIYVKAVLVMALLCGRDILASRYCCTRLLTVDCIIVTLSIIFHLKTRNTLKESCTSKLYAHSTWVPACAQWGN
jgi:hypothetical protein